MSYEIWNYKNSEARLMKVYPFKIQAVVWCFLHGYAYSANRYYFLDKDIHIKEVK